MKNLLIIISILLIISCKTPLDKLKLNKDIQEIYNLALENTTGSDTIVRYDLRLPPEPPNNDEILSLEKKLLKKSQDSLKQILIDAELFVVVNHKLEILSSSDIADIREMVTSKKNILTNQLNGDTSFNEAIKELCNNNLISDSIETTKLRTKFNYKIYTDKAFPRDKIRHIGSVRFSKVGFSRNKNKAAVYTSFICGGLCGSGQILFFENVNKKWKHVKTWDLWIS